MKKMKRVGLAVMALGMGIGTGVGVTASVQPTQQAEAMGAGVFGTTQKMKTYRTVYYNYKGKKDAVYYKGTTYTVQKSYINGYYKVYIKGEGYRYMRYQDVFADMKR